MASSKKSSTSEEAGFTGFPRGGARFFHELALEQSREWFHDHKPEYERLWQTPMQALLEAVHAGLVRAYKPKLALAPPKLFRIQRDVRFSKDKSPYKTNIAGVLMMEAPSTGTPMSTPAALYMHFGMEQVAAAGTYALDGPALARYRAAVDDPKKGAALQKIVDGLAADGLTLGAQQTLAKMPRGFAPDHPRAELLRLKGLMVRFPPIPAKTQASAALVDHLVEAGTRAKPLLQWLMTHVTG